MNTKGEETLLGWTFLEVVLAAVFLIAVGVGLFRIVDGNAFYQNFYAKDNAYLMESLASVPNGAAHVGYLWRNPGQSITFGTEDGAGLIRGSYVEVASASKEQHLIKRKYYGASEEMQVATQTFIPLYYEFVLAPGIPRTLRLEQQWGSQTCPSSSVDIRGLSVTATTVGPTIQAGTIAADVMQAVLTAKSGALANTGTEVHIILRETTADTLATIYYRSPDPSSVRLACTLSRAMMTTGMQQVAYGQQSQADEPARSAAGDIIILIDTRGATDVGPLTQAITEGILGYWKP